MKSFLFFLFFSQFSFAIECKYKIDPTYILTAKATGGGVFCRDNKKFDPNDPVELYNLDKVRFLAFWKILGHGSLDSYIYSPNQVPSDKVKIELVDFPTSLYRIEKLYAESSSGEKSDPAEFLPELKMETTSNKSSKLINFKLKPRFKEFKLVLEGKTHKGTPFVQYSKAAYMTAKLTDKESGIKVWKEIFATFVNSKNPLSEEVKSKFLKEAFEE